VETLRGANPQELSNLVAIFSQQTPSVTQPETNVSKSADDLNGRLHKLVTSSKVMTFIKGTPAAPQCGFSSKFCQLLKENGIQFGSFNILTDPEVRQGLKTFSNWPTFPQLYVNGEFIGGLDIIKELAEAGELIPLVNGNK